jgi:GNAT superfamily N-acetyltransferase
VTLSIRTAASADLDQLRDIYRRSSLHNDGDRDALLAHPDALVFAPDGRVGDRIRVAEIAERIAGFATLSGRPDVLELDDLFVDPDHMRTGVARALVADAMDIAHRSGATHISVTANPHAMAFYETVGFQPDGMTTTEFGPGLRMRLEVS